MAGPRRSRSRAPNGTSRQPRWGELATTPVAARSMAAKPTPTGTRGRCGRLAPEARSQSARRSTMTSGGRWSPTSSRMRHIGLHRRRPTVCCFAVGGVPPGRACAGSCRDMLSASGPSRLRARPRNRAARRLVPPRSKPTAMSGPGWRRFPSALADHDSPRSFLAARIAPRPRSSIAARRLAAAPPRSAAPGPAGCWTRAPGPSRRRSWRARRRRRRPRSRRRGRAAARRSSRPRRT